MACLFDLSDNLTSSLFCLFHLFSQLSTFQPHCHHHFNPFIPPHSPPLLLHKITFKMMSLRSLVRSVPRTVSRSVASSVPSAALRPGSTIPKSLFQSPLKQVTKPAYAAFSTFPSFRQAAEGKTHWSCSRMNSYLGKFFLSGHWKLASHHKIGHGLN